MYKDGTSKTNNISLPHCKLEYELWQIYLQLTQQALNNIHAPLFLSSDRQYLEQFLMLLKQRYQLTLASSEFIQHSSIADLANLIQNKQQTENFRSYPLSLGQKRLWLAEQFDNTSCLYYVPIVLKFSGHLDQAIFLQSLVLLFKRHAILNTVYREKNDAITQQFQHKQLTLENQHFNTTQPPVHRVMQSINEQMQQPFDLKQGPLYRTSFYTIDSSHYYWCIIFHHSIFDGGSTSLFLHELSILYNKLSNKSTDSLASTSQYKDFITWQQSYLQTDIFNNKLKFWQKYLSQHERLQFLTDKPKQPQQKFIGKNQTIHLTKQQYAQLKENAKKNNVSLNILLLTYFVLLLYRYTRQKNLCFGSVATNRRLAEHQEMIGFFTEIFPVCFQWDGDISFVDLLQLVKKSFTQAYENSDVSFDILVEKCLPPNSNQDENPFFDIAFIMQNEPVSDLNFHSLEAELVNVNTGMGTFDLTFNITPNSSTLCIQIYYNKNLFEHDTIAAFAQHYLTLLKLPHNNTKQHTHTIASLPLFSSCHAAQALLANTTQVAYREDKGVHYFFEQQVKSQPNALALVCYEKEITYKQLNQQANQLATYLLTTLGQNHDKNTFVGIHFKRSPALIIATLACFKSGLVFIPLETDKESAELMHYKLANSQATTLICHENDSVLFKKQTRLSLICLHNDGNINTSHATNELDKSDLNVKLTHHDLAFVPYTSGTTGKPKGVLVEHRGLINWVLTQQVHLNITHKDKIYLFSPFSFDASLWEILMALAHGAELHINNESQRIDPLQIKQLFRENQITFATLTPSLLETFAPKDFPCLRAIIVTGEYCAPQLIQKWHSDSCKIYNAYGTTETTIGTFHHCVKEDWNSVGLPTPNTQIFILDEKQQLLPPGICGQIYIAGPIARGYLAQPQLTKENFVVIAVDGQTTTAYKTGDFGRILTNGKLQLLGRKDTQVKIQGVRVELQAIEAHLRQHSSIKQALAVTSGATSQQFVVVYYVLHDHKQITQTQLQQHFAASTLHRNTLPSAFIELTTLPLTLNGKIDIAALPRAKFNANQTTIQVQPRNKIEKIIQANWCGILQHKNINLYDNFFHLGGRSLQAVSVINKLNQLFSIQLTLNTLYQHPTLIDLANQIKLQQKTAKLKPSSNDKLSAFFISPTNDISCYAAIASELNHYIDSYFLPAIHSDEYAIESLAQQHLQKIPTNRPMILGAWSSAAPIAIKMAKLLEVTHQQTTVILFDAISPLFLHQIPADKRFLFLQKIILNFGIDLSSIINKRSTPDQLIQAGTIEQVRYLFDSVLKKNHNEQLASLKTTLLSILAYHPDCDEKIKHLHLYITNRTQNDYNQLLQQNDQHVGWDAYCSNITNKKTAGDHFSLLNYPHVIALANQLKELMVTLTQKRTLENAD